MAARATMAYVITMLRELCYDEDSARWTDDQLEQRLDVHRTRVNREQLANDAQVKIYQSAHRLFEGDASSWSGDPTVALWDSPANGATEKDPDTFNLEAGTFTFTTGQGSVYYLDGWSYYYAMYMAAAYCLRVKSSDPAFAHLWGEGGIYHSSTPPLMLAREYQREAGVKSFKLRRIYGD